MRAPDGSLPAYEPEQVRPRFEHRSIAVAGLFFAALGGLGVYATGHWGPLLGAGVSWFIVACRLAAAEAAGEQRVKAIDAANAVPDIEIQRAAMREMAPQDRILAEAVNGTADRKDAHERAGGLYQAQLAARINGWLYRIYGGR